MFKVITFFFALFYCTTVFAQQLEVIGVQLYDKERDSSPTEVPMLVDENDPENPIVQSINVAIMDFFMINSFNPEELEGFSWYDVQFTSEMTEELLCLEISGTYLGAYPNEISEALFFDLATGEQLYTRDIPFHALFTADGYLDFLSTYWIPKAKNEFHEAIECAEGTEPYCDMYDIPFFNFDADQFSCWNTYDCYPRVILACSPFINISLPADTAEKYLNEFGRKVIMKDEYPKMAGIKRYQYNNSVKERMPYFVFLFGKIDDKYPIIMALDLNQIDTQVKGGYFYENKLLKLSLEGKSVADKLVLTESYNGKKSGSFEIGLLDDSLGKKQIDTSNCVWVSANKKKSFYVSFDKILYSFNEEY